LQLSTPGRFYPEELVREIRSHSEAEFSRLWRSTEVLLVRVDDPSSDVYRWLKSTSASHGAPLVASRDGIGFATSMMSLQRKVGLGGPALPRALTASSIVDQLSQSSYFVAPLRKRESEGKPFAERISVGRAPNNDIVLRHRSVSKFHAWFECDYDGLLYLNDANSTNHTFSNGQQLQPGESRQLGSGTEVTFGEITCIVCSAAMVWEVLDRART